MGRRIIGHEGGNMRGNEVRGSSKSKGKRRK